jgi:hypothetical protein
MCNPRQAFTVTGEVREAKDVDMGVFHGASRREVADPHLSLRKEHPEITPRSLPRYAAATASSSAPPMPHVHTPRSTASSRAITPRATTPRASNPGVVRHGSVGTPRGTSQPGSNIARGSSQPMSIRPIQSSVPAPPMPPPMASRPALEQSDDGATFATDLKRGDAPVTIQQTGDMYSTEHGSAQPTMADAAHSFISGPSEVPTGKTAVLLIAACDVWGVPVQHGGDPFVASVHGPAACQTEMRDLLDGRYELRVLAPPLSGDFRVSVTLRGRAIGGSPHALTVLAPVAHAAHCDARGAALELATAGEPSSFEIVANDAHNRKMTYGGEQFAIRLVKVADVHE